MVKVKEKFPHLSDGSIDLSSWLQKIEKKYNPPQFDLIKNTCEFAFKTSQGLTTFYGQPCIEQGLEMAEIILDLKLDTDAVAAAIMISTAHHTNLTSETIKKQLGEEVENLVTHVLRMNIINSIANLSQTKDQAHIDRLRKTLLAMVSDIRVVIIKLAERTALMRGIKNINTYERKRFAQETMDIYAPLANRLGIGQLKWELEDLGFHYLDSESYKAIANFLSEKRIDREDRIKKVISRLKEQLKKAKLEAEVTGRAKHIYSIYRKKQLKQLDYKKIFDYSAFRILVPSKEDCYNALGIVHNLWKQLPDEFDDYISNPKPNGYQSIHTAVEGPDGKTFEIQIRTQKMHEQAEHGVAAHWIYKEKIKHKTDYDEKITYLRQLLAWQNDISKEDRPKNLTEIFADRVYVFTPAGDIIDLPVGATPVDFAYHIHSELGHRCRGAKIDGHIVPLNHELHTGNQIELLTTSQGAPSLDWLNPELGYVKTSRARAKISQWFRHQEPPAAEEEKHPERELSKKTVLPASAPSKKPSEITPSLKIEGVNNLLSRIARCCKPIPGDDIIGFITQGRGISIHRKNCNNIASIKFDNEKRLIPISWDSKELGSFYVDIYIRAQGKGNILKDIPNLLSNLKINLIALSSHTNQKNDMIHITLTIQIGNVSQLNQLMNQVNQLSFVYEIRRIRN